MAVTNYIWDVENDSYLMETDQADSTTAVYSNEPVEFGNLISQRRSTDTSYYHFDATSSTRQLTDNAETVTDTNLYDAWSAVVTISGTTENAFWHIGQIGYYSDNVTGEVYVRTRLYIPSLGHWSSLDPLLIDGLNRYTYSRNDPLNYIDPTGLFCALTKCCCCAQPMEFTLVNEIRGVTNLTECFRSKVKTSSDTYGHDFIISVRMSTHVTTQSADDLPCERHYNEASNKELTVSVGKDRRTIIKACARPVDTCEILPESRTCDDLTKPGIKCPRDRSEGRVVRDCPITPLRSRRDDRLLCIQVTLKSTCTDCQYKETAYYVKQLCKYNDGKPRCTLSHGGPDKGCQTDEWYEYCPEKPNKEKK